MNISNKVRPYLHKSNSPFRYPGGKFYARKLILKHIPSHTHYCEPFAGGASIFFAKSKAKVSILNDLDPDIMNTFIQIRDHVESLIEMLHDIPATKALHTFYKKEYQPTNDLERAFRWFYLNRTSYSGIMKPENCYWGFGHKYSMRPENWPHHLRTVSHKLNGVLLKSLDFEEFINHLPDRFFLFVDPPYYAADQKKFYCYNFDLEDHQRLASCLYRNAHRIQFLITYDNHEDIRKLYDWTTEINQQEWQYTINRTDDQKNRLQKRDGYKRSRNKGQELFIRNYAITSQMMVI